MTSALNKNDMKGIGLQLALDLIHAKKSVDMITGLRTKTSPGRPNWDKVCISHTSDSTIRSLLYNNQAVYIQFLNGRQFFIFM